MTKRAAGILTIIGAVFLAAVTLQPQPFSVGMSHLASGDAATDRPATIDRRAEREITPELVEQWLQVAEEVDPAKGRQLRAMCHHDPDEFHRVMRQTGRSIIGLAELKAEDPDLYELKIAELRIEAQVNAATDALAEAIASADEASIAAREEDLRRWLRMQVLHSIRARGDYVLRLKQHVERLEQELAYEAENFEQTVERRFRDVAAKTRALAAGG